MMPVQYPVFEAILITFRSDKAQAAGGARGRGGRESTLLTRESHSRDHCTLIRVQWPRLASGTVTGTTTTVRQGRRRGDGKYGRLNEEAGRHDNSCTHGQLMAKTRRFIGWGLMMRVYY